MKSRNSVMQQPEEISFHLFPIDSAPQRIVMKLKLLFIWRKFNNRLAVSVRLLFDISELVHQFEIDNVIKQIPLDCSPYLKCFEQLSSSRDSSQSSKTILTAFLLIFRNLISSIQSQKMSHLDL
jgi:hypothetical protein